jgi:hypothetical protein
MADAAPFVERCSNSSPRRAGPSRALGLARGVLLRSRQFQETPMTAFRPRHAVAAFALVLAAGAGHAAGLDIHADADAADVGLPAYPGAVKKAEKRGDPAGFSFGVWGDSFGVKLAVVGYRSTDSVEAVAAFYRDAMGRYGPVLDCSHNQKRPDATPRASRDDDKKSSHDRPVTCDDDTAEAGGRLFKVGTNGAQRVVKVSPWHDGASFELVRVESHGTD